MPIDECGPSIIRNFYDSSGKPTLKKSLQKVKQIADRYNVKLIVIFNQVACEDSEQIIPIHNDLEIFKKKNPDVYIPFGFITSIDKEEFSDHWHLTPDASIPHSHKVGKVLGNYINRASIKK